MKDFIFKEQPTNSNKVNFHYHLQLNKRIEGMKSEIRQATTVKNAVDLLFQKFGRDDILGIVQAVREVFQVGHETIGKYL